MKRIFFIVVFLPFFNFTYAQDSKPSYEDSKDWLVTKLKAYMDFSHLDLPKTVMHNYEDFKCFDTWSIYRNHLVEIRNYGLYFKLNRNFKGSSYTTIFIPLLDITSIDADVIHTKIASIYIWDTECLSNIKVDRLYIAFNFDQEENLKERVNTALKVLQSYCPKPQKETF